MIARSYLLNNVACFDKPDDKGIDPEIARKAAIEAERAKISVTKVDIEDDADDNKIDDNEDEKDDNEQKDENGKEETSENDNKEDDEEKSDNDDKDDKKENKEDSRLKKQYERTEKKLAREAQKRRDAEKRIKELEAKLAADPDKSKLSEEDIEALADKKADQKQYVKQIEATGDRLADEAQKLLKMSSKKFNDLVKDVVEDIGFTPAIVVELLGELDNGGAVAAHLFSNIDEAEELYRLQNKPAKLGMALAKLSAKLAKPVKQISKVPDPVEPLGGKSAGGDRFAILNAKKNLTQSETNELIAIRNAEVAEKRKNGRVNLR